MAVTYASDDPFEIITITDDAGADITETITFKAPVKIISVFMQKSVALFPGTFSITLDPHKIAGGPQVLLGCVTLEAGDEARHFQDPTAMTSLDFGEIVVASVGTGAGTKCTIIYEHATNQRGKF